MTRSELGKVGKIGLLKRDEVGEADRILRMAFGTYLGMPNPAEFMGDRDFMRPRWRAEHVTVLAARDDGRLIGTNVLTRWGSFAFFGPLTVQPEYWNRGVAQRLMAATVKTFDEWGVRHSGLFTFANSARHVGLYQKFGYWPRYLTAVLTRTPEPDLTPLAERNDAAWFLSRLDEEERERTIEACRKLTGRIDVGLDLTGEMRAALKQRTGDVVLTYTRGVLDGFAVCLTGLGSEGGKSVCYVKFAAARGGPGGKNRLNALLTGCEAFAALRGATVEAGVNLAREEAYGVLRARGYRVTTLGVGMQRPHLEGFNRTGAFVLDDWR